MTSKLNLYNNALGHLGPVRLATVTEERPDRRELDAVYDAAVEYMLAQANWDFALRTVQIDADGDYAPAVGTSRQYAFVIPDDFVRLSGISSDENFSIELFNYEREGNLWYASNETIYVKYVSNGVDYGLNLGAYSPMFTEALGAWIAFKAALPVTKDKMTKADIFAYHQRFLNRARELEAIADPVKGKPPGNWGASRGRGSSGTYFRANGRMGFR